MDINKLKKQFNKEFPGSKNRKACFADNMCGEEYCVWDENEPYNCDIASKGIKKNKCKYWKSELLPLFYERDDIWKWLERKLKIL